MKIYFAGSIRAGRDDVPIYEQIIGYLKKYGEVLTEHVGDYSLSIAGQNQLDDKFIHDRDLEWLKSSHIVVAEVTNPSLGVGYELASAVQWNIPVIAFYRRNNNLQLSAMILGADGINVYEYEKLDELFLVLEERFKGGV